MGRPGNWICICKRLILDHVSGGRGGGVELPTNPTMQLAWLYAKFIFYFKNKLKNE